ncbi:hypothetical protein OC861_005308 [Tilletia horrida]|nr:hypothetical protein OC845_006692 [Tilletia horrida]KAK0562434.1 hypothetical protein OC861_005308 [Tilletia horrida]
MALPDSFITDPTDERETSRLQDQVARLQHRLGLLEARMTTIESASGLFGPLPSSTFSTFDRQQDTSYLEPSGSTRARSPGSVAPSTLHQSFTPSVKSEPALSSSAAAAALASRYGKLRSIAQGSRSLGRKSSSATPLAAEDADPTKMPLTRQVSLKNGICLVMDRRLIGETFLTKYTKRDFERIVDEHRLRIFPFISKTATAAQVDHMIVASFKKAHINLVADGHIGYEYAFISIGDHKLRTLGVTDEPRDQLTGTELASEYAKRECYIVVKDKLQFPAYTPLLRKSAQVIADDTDEEDNEPAFQRCPTCRQHFGRSTYAEHIASCTHRGSMSSSSSTYAVKKEQDQEALFRPLDEEDDYSASLSSISCGDVEHDCCCRSIKDEPLLTCFRDSCSKQSHRSCLELIEDFSDPWTCKTCRIMRPQSPSPRSLELEDNETPQQATRRVRRAGNKDTATKLVDQMPEQSPLPGDKGKKRGRSEEEPAPKSKTSALRWSSRLTQK